MASKKITMYSEKKYELEELKDGMKSEFYKIKLDAEMVGEVVRELGETKTLLLIFEKYYLRTESHASLLVLLSEFRGYQSADIIATGGKELFFFIRNRRKFCKMGRRSFKKSGILSKSQMISFSCNVKLCCGIVKLVWWCENWLLAKPFDALKPTIK